MKKRLLAVLLCAVLLCGLLPIHALALPPYTMTLDCNGGTLNGEASQVLTVPLATYASLTLPSDVPEREGYLFKEWNTERDGSGTAYAPEDRYFFVLSTAVTLYARWEMPRWIDFADTSWYDADPTAAAYTISTAEQLAGVAKLLSDNVTLFYNTTLTLAGDISLAGKEWTPIGLINDGVNVAFCGTFDGAGHTVSGLFIDAPDSNSQALFGVVNDATIKKVRVSGHVSGGNQSAGLVAEASHTLIENCVNDCTVFGKNTVGGVVAFSTSSVITGCANLADICADTADEGTGDVGGIVGTNYGFVSNCYNVGDISGVNMVGGIVGYTHGTSAEQISFVDPAVYCVAHIYNCYNIGGVTGAYNVAGIAGYTFGSVVNCYNLGILESTETVVAGVALTPDTPEGLLTDCYYLADCNVAGTVLHKRDGTALSSEAFRRQTSFSGFDFDDTWEMSAMAPVLKSFNNKGTADNPHPLANLEMLTYMRDSVNSGSQAFFGSAVVLLRDIDLGCDEDNQWEPIGTNQFEFCADFDGKGHVVTGLYINRPTEDYQGFFGCYGGLKITRNFGVYGTVIGRNNVGGIAGLAYGNFEACFNACDVTGERAVAGIVGGGSYSNYRNCYNLGDITCRDDGCAGIGTDPYYTVVTNCYNFGTIDCAGADSYPIVNLTKYGNTIRNCYYLDGCQAAGTTFGTGDGVSALSAAAFADMTKFVDWDFETVWDLSDSAVRRPILKTAAEKGTDRNPFKVAYTDDRGGEIVHELYYVTSQTATPACQTDLTDMLGWKFIAWDKPIAATVTGDVTYTARLAKKGANTIVFYGNGGTCLIDGESYDAARQDSEMASATLNPACTFTRDGYRLVGWNTQPDGTGTTYQVGDTFAFYIPHNGDQYSLHAVWQDSAKPVFVGIEDGKTYCKSVKFKVTDNGGAVSVTVDGTPLTVGDDGYYTLANVSDPNLTDYTLVATDAAGNTATIVVTVNKEHMMGKWDNDGAELWRVCSGCGLPDTEKHPLPRVTVVGKDTVCRSEKYTFTFTLPENCECGDGLGAIDEFIPQLQADGTYRCVVENNGDYHGLDSFTVFMEIHYSPDGGYPYIFSINKAVRIVEHAGGSANCQDKAVCTACGKPYGETDPQTHKALTHVAAKPATAEETGNREYWYCAACDACFADKDGQTAIAKDAVTLEKLAPTITEGDAQTVTAGDNRTLTFRSNAAFADLIRVEVDGTVLDGSRYTARSGSTVVTLSGDYVASLSAGRHTLSIVSAGGTATATFTVKAADTPAGGTPSAPNGGNQSGTPNTPSGGNQPGEGGDTPNTPSGGNQPGEGGDTPNTPSGGNQPGEGGNTETAAPTVTEGDAQTVTAGDGQAITFRLNAATTLLRVEVDGVALDNSRYTVGADGTTVTLNGDYLAALLAGQHTVKLVSAGGTATATFTVEAAKTPAGETPSVPTTGDTFPLLLLVTVFFVGAAGLCGTAFFRKKKSVK